MTQKSRTLAHITLSLLLCALFLVPTAYADFGPKPEVTITVVNTPEGELYLDLLTEGRPSNNPWFDAEDEAEYTPAILSSLRSLEGNGWVLAYSTGAASSAPISGSLRPQADGTWSFSYIGLPKTFRVAAATADEAKAADTAYTRPFMSHIVYDWESNTVRDATPPLLRFFARLAATLLPTIVIEGLIFYLFGFREKRSWLVFFGANLATQVSLHLYMGMEAAIVGWYFPTYLLAFLLPELVILAAETAAYAILLKEHDRYQRVGYALLANTVSFVAGYLPLHLLYDFLKSL